MTWRPGTGLVPGPATTGAPALAVADSWLVDSGRVRGLDRHRARFTAACAAEGRDTGAFWAAAVAALPRTGAWFPRAELHRDGTLGLRLRPAPPRGTTIRVLPWAGPDPRRAPRVKGPDLDRLGEVRSRALAAGADDALLTTDGGVLLESATATLLWWQDEGLCTPDPALRLLPGVTLALVRDLADAAGVPVRHRRARLADLAGREAWLVNALHGIRPVTEWTGTGLPPGPARHAAEWRRRLDALARPLDDR
nr:aminotransferase class IV [Streptomyces sp. SID5468]